MIQGRVEAAGGKNSLRVIEGMVESVWRPGSFVDVDDARDAILAVERISGGTPMPMLSEMTDVEFSAAARYAFAQSTGVLAIAVLGSSKVDRVVAAGTSRHTTYPHEFFVSKAAALAWLTHVVGRSSDPDKNGIGSIELSDEPVPFREGGEDAVPWWPTGVDPLRRPGY